MKRALALCVLGLLILPAVTLAQSDSVVAEIEKLLAEAYAQESGDDNRVSKHGSHEFWSNGGGMLRIEQGAPAEFDVSDLTQSDLEVIPLADGVVAAMYTNEGSLKPKGQPAVPNYKVRVTDVFVKEDGHWRFRLRHFSPAADGAGTSEPME